MRRYSFIFSFIFALLLASVVLIDSSSVSAGNGNGGRPRTPRPTRTTAPIYTPTPLPTSTPLSTHTPAATATPQPNPEEMAQQTIQLINERRVAMGRQLLSADVTLPLAARRHSNDVGPLGLCTHIGSDGSTPSSRVAEAGYPGSYMGEVVACGFRSPQAAVDAWWNSPGHYAVLTDSRPNNIGCGWWLDSQGYGWVTCNTGTTP